MAANLGAGRAGAGTIAGVARIQVVGSINLDLVVSASHLPHAGETVGGAGFARHPGGKGANQALAARRLGADVDLAGTVGEDPFAEEALSLLIAGGVGFWFLKVPVLGGLAFLFAELLREEPYYPD